jgi:hypothetical protein
MRNCARLKIILADFINKFADSPTILHIGVGCKITIATTDGDDIMVRTSMKTITSRSAAAFLFSTPADP